MLTEVQRLDYLIYMLCSGSPAVFSKKTGIPRDRISRIRSGELRLNRWYDNILTAYPQVCKKWLLTGKGIAGDLNQESKLARLEKEVAKLRKSVADLERLIIRGK